MSAPRSEVQSVGENKMCVGCKVFYGTESFEGLCSVCYKKQCNKKEELETKVVHPQKISPVSLQKVQAPSQCIFPAHQTNKKRCFNCGKKVGLLGIECKCGLIFCNGHRLPEQHNCTFDYQINGKKKLEKEMVKVYNGKIAQI